MALAALLMTIPNAAVAWAPNCDEFIYTNRVPDANYGQTGAKRSFSNMLAALNTNALLQLVRDKAPEYAAWLNFHPSVMDINGGYQEDPEFAIFPNGMLDEREFSFIQYIINHPELDVMVDDGGTPRELYDVAYEAWCNNLTQLYHDISGPEGDPWCLFFTMLPGLQYVLAGMVTVGDDNTAEVLFELLGMFDPDDPDMDPEIKQYIDMLLPNFQLPVRANYILKPQFFSMNGDPDGDGYTNYEEYVAFGFEDAGYFAAALDPTMKPPPRKCQYNTSLQKQAADLMKALVGENGLPQSETLLDHFSLFSWSTLDFEDGAAWITWCDGGGSGAEPALGDGIPDSWQLALLTEVLCREYVDPDAKAAWQTYSANIYAAFQSNVAAVEAAVAALPAGEAKDFWDANVDLYGEFVAAVCGLSQSLQDAWLKLLNLEGAAVVVFEGGTGVEVFSDAGDLDDDGDSNLDEYTAVLGYGSDRDGFLRAAMYNSPFWSGNPDLPAAGLLGLGLTACACALGAAVVIRRRK